MPAAQAVQAVSKTYVDQSISQAIHSQITPSGGTLTGPLYLSGDPSQANQAANKHYVDQVAAQDLSLGGGNLTGPVYLAGDPTDSTQAANKHYVDQTVATALPLSGGTLKGPITATQIGALTQADQLAGGDFGAKLQACISRLDANYGGTCDARNFSGALTMSANLTLSTPNATIYLPCSTIATAFSIVVPARTRNVTLHGCASRGTSAASGSQGGTVFLYSGSTALLQIGDKTYGADTNGFHADNMAINTTASSSAVAQAIAAYRTQELTLSSLYLLGNGNQMGITLDGTGNYTGGTFSDLQLTGFQTGINGIGHQAANSATTDWLNASTFLRLHIVCPTSNGNPIAGTTGINLQAGDGNTFTGGDVESCATALHLGSSAQNNTLVGVRNENSTTQVLADAGSAYNNWMTGGTMFNGKLVDNGTRNSFLDTYHRSFNSLNGDWYGSQQDATVTNHFRLGIGTGTERGLLNRYQSDYGYRWTTGISDASAGEQYYQILDELNNVYRLSIGQYNHGQASSNNQTVLNAAGTGAILLNGSAGSGTGGVLFGSGGSTVSTVASVDKSGNALFNGALQVSGTAQSSGNITLRNNADAEVDYYLWPGLSSTQKGAFTYKDYNGASQWYLVKDQYNNWALNSAVGGLDSFKAYQSTNSGDTYINAANATGHIRLNYETGAGAETDIYSGSSSSLAAAFLGPTAIKFPGLASGSSRNCLQIDNSGYLSNFGQPCGTAASVPATGLTFPDSSVQTTSQQGALTGAANDATARSAAASAQSAATAAQSTANAAQTAISAETTRAQSGEAAAQAAASQAETDAQSALIAAQAAQASTNALPANGATSSGTGASNVVTFPGQVQAGASVAVGGASLPAGITGSFIAQYGFGFGGWSNSDPTKIPSMIIGGSGVSGQRIYLWNKGNGSMEEVLVPCNGDATQPLCADSLHNLTSQIILMNVPGSNYSRWGTTWYGNTHVSGVSAHNSATNLNWILVGGGRIFDGDYCHAQGWDGYGSPGLSPLGTMFAPICQYTSPGVGSGGLVPAQNAAQVSPDASFLLRGDSWSAPYYGAKTTWGSQRSTVYDFSNSGSSILNVMARGNVGNSMHIAAFPNSSNATITLDSASPFPAGQWVYVSNTRWTNGSGSSMYTTTKSVPLQVQSSTGSSVTLNNPAPAATGYSYVSESGYLAALPDGLAVTAAVQGANSTLTVSGFDPRTLVSAGDGMTFYVPGYPDWTFTGAVTAVDATHVQITNVSSPSEPYPGGGVLFRSDALGTFASFKEDVAGQTYGTGNIKYWQWGLNSCQTNLFNASLYNLVTGHCPLVVNQSDQVIAKSGFYGSGTSAAGQTHFGFSAPGADGATPLLRFGCGLIDLESGGNAGSNAYCAWYNDDGTLGATVSKFTRSTQLMDWRSAFQFSGNVYLPGLSTANKTPVCIDNTTSPANQVKTCIAGTDFVTPGGTVANATNATNATTAANATGLNGAPVPANLAVAATDASGHIVASSIGSTALNFPNSTVCALHADTLGGSSPPTCDNSGIDGNTLTAFNWSYNLSTFAANAEWEVTALFKAWSASSIVPSNLKLCYGITAGTCSTGLAAIAFNGTALPNGKTGDASESLTWRISSPSSTTLETGLWWSGSGAYNSTAQPVTVTPNGGANLQIFVQYPSATTGNALQLLKVSIRRVG